MKKVLTILGAALALLVAVDAGAVDSANINFSITIGDQCIAVGGDPDVIFTDSGADTSIQSGSFSYQCTSGTTPSITFSGDGTQGGTVDFSGRMLNGMNEIAFTGMMTAPYSTAGTGIGAGQTKTQTFDVTASGLTGKPAGTYTTTLVFTINP